MHQIAVLTEPKVHDDDNNDQNNLDINHAYVAYKCGSVAYFLYTIPVLRLVGHDLTVFSTQLRQYCTFRIVIFIAEVATVDKILWLVK